MKNPEIIVRVKFKTALSPEQVRKTIASRIGEFRALPGLTQKYYLHNESTDEYGGLYLWQSRQAFDDYLQSELRASIARAYQTIGAPEVEVYQVIETLRPTAG